MNGLLDPQSGCPTIDVEVSGPFAQPQKFTAMVDTGFSGFLSLPILRAFPLGLLLQGTMGITLADGSTHPRLTARGLVNFDGKSVIGLVVLEWQNTDVLLGMDFLKKFGKRLTIDAVSGTVEILDAGPAPAAIPSALPAPSSTPTAEPPPSTPTI